MGKEGRENSTHSGHRSARKSSCLLPVQGRRHMNEATLVEGAVLTECTTIEEVNMPF
jgi:hypothetical protein